MNHTKLLVITNDNHMSDTQRTALTARVQLIAEKVGAELLVLGPGQGADLVIAPVMPSKATAGEIKAALRGAGKSNIPAFVPIVRCGRGENGPELEVTGPSRIFSAASVEAMLRGKPSVEAAPVSAIQGEAISFSLDPLEQAIESTVRMVRDEHQKMTETGAQRETALSDRLGSHLEALLAEQLKRVITDGVQTNEGA